jgi:hypothetical protein
MLSEAGRANVLQTLAAKEAAPAFARAQAAYSDAEKRIAASRDKLRPGVKDSDNVAAALFRGELRAKIGNDPSKVLTLINDPETDGRIIEALLEMPRALSGIPADVFDRTMVEVIARKHPTESAALNEQEAALEVIGAGLRAVDGGLREATGLKAPSEFAKWFTEATKDTKPDVLDTAADVDGLATDAAKLPLGTRMSLVDRLLKTNTDQIVGAAA